MARKSVTEDFQIFPKRLSDLMKEKNLKQKDLADYLGIKRQTVSLYMTGQSMPDAEQVKNIAVFFNVSADWLLGLSNARATSGDVRQVCNFTGLSQSAVEHLHSYNELHELRKEAALDIVNEVVFSAALFNDCLWRSVLADIQAKKSVLNGNSKGWQAYWGKRDLDAVDEAFKPAGSASDGIEIPAIEASVLYQIQAVENIKRAAERVLYTYREKFVKLIADRHNGGE